MTGPTREEVEEWAKRAKLPKHMRDTDAAIDALMRFAAFAAGSRSASGAGAPGAADKIVDEYAEEYEFDDCGNFHLPTEQEGTLLVDFGHGLVARLQEAGLLSTGAPAAALSGSRSGEDARDAALDLLETMYRLWENGIDCYLDPEDQTGYLGKAVDLDDPTERKIADLLNEHRPAKSGRDAAMGGNDA